jgi:hypothetical protein
MIPVLRDLKVEPCHQDYCAVRPHIRIDYLTPPGFKGHHHLAVTGTSFRKDCKNNLAGLAPRFFVRAA